MSDGSSADSSTSTSSTEKAPEALPSFEAILASHRAADDAKAARRPAAWRFFRETLGQPKFFLAPMVDCSVLPFRLLCKRHGTDLGVSPMIHAFAMAVPLPFSRAHTHKHKHRAIYVRDATFRKKAFQSCAEDRPSIAQLAGRDADAMVQAARMLEDAGECVAVDVNLGCPQRVAKKGAYGAYLADDPRLVEEIVGRMCRECRGPVTCKMRVTDSIADSIAFAQMLERCGCAMITVHGRTKSQISVKDAPVNWAAIASIVFVVPLSFLPPCKHCPHNTHTHHSEAVDVPVVANGGIRSLDDAKRCLIETKAQAVMAGSLLFLFHLSHTSLVLNSPSPLSLAHTQTR